MKRKILQFTTLALLLITPTISCKKDEPLNGITLDKTVTVLVGETATLTVTFIPNSATNKKISWESSDPCVATVENGKLTGISIGTTKITATSEDGGHRAQCTVYVIQPIEPEVVWVEGGTFTMGCTDEQGEDCFDNEKPDHKVTVGGFYIGKYQVTQKEWLAIMVTDTPCGNHPDKELPMHVITWNQAQEYIMRLNATTDKNYRLPTEAEWEYAARGGNKSQGYKYSGSNNFDEVAWCVDNDFHFPYPVGTKKSNELEIYDMSGNVWEFCSDWYGSYTVNSQTNPQGPPTGTMRIIRGGSWATQAVYTRVSTRSSVTPGENIGNAGFRLVLPKD